MSGKGKRRGRYQGRGVWWCRGRGRDSRGNSYYGSTTKHKGLCSDLGNYDFEYDPEASVDQTKTTREKLVHHVETIHEPDIRNELQNNKTVITPKPDHTQDLFNEQKLSIQRWDQSYQHLEEARQFQKRVLEDQIIDREHTTS